MDPPKLIVSQSHVAVKVVGEIPPEAVNEIADAGETFAILPVAEARGVETLPVLEDPATGVMAIPTRRLSLRGDPHTKAVQQILSETGARLIRDYGIGGMIEADSVSAARDLARRLLNVEGVTRAEQQLLQPRSFR